MQSSSALSLIVTSALGLVSHVALAGPPGGLDSLSPHAYRAQPARVSDWIGGGSLAGGMGIQVGHGLANDDWRGVGATSGALLLTGGLTELTKVLSSRRRPYTWDPSVSAYGVQGYCRESAPVRADDCKSFFSGHTALTAASVFSTVHSMQRRGQLSTPSARALAYSGAVLLTVSTASMRVLAGKHYVSDVAVGALVGGGIGMAIPGLFYRAD